MQSLWGGYGELVRVELTGWQAPSVIVKCVEPPAHAARQGGVSHARKLRSYDVELAFYRAFAPRTDASCRVARAIHAERTRARWRLVLEDLDAAGFSERRRVASPHELELCLRWLAAFHARFLQTEPKGLWKTGTYWHLATRREELERTRDAELRAAAPILDRKLSEARFATLVHGDAKLANFCFSSDAPAVAAVDFQYVGGGVGVKDVAYLLSDGAPHSERAEQQLLDCYFSNLRQALAETPVDADALEREWRELYPIACADFYRFLAGWAPAELTSDARARQLIARVLAKL